MSTLDVIVAIYLFPVVIFTFAFIMELLHSDNYDWDWFEVAFIIALWPVAVILYIIEHLRGDTWNC